MKAIYLLLLLVGFSYSQIETLLSVPDTSSLKTMSVGLGGAMFLRGYSSSTNNGAGIYIVVDSAYAEGTQAFDHPTRGYQWYLMSNQTLNDSSVAGSKIQSATINTSNLANSSITTSKLADSSVTSAKIATGAVTVDIPSTLSALTETRLGYPVYLQSVSNTINTGGGWFTLRDSSEVFVNLQDTLVKGGAAFASAQTGRYWVRDEWYVRKILRPEWWGAKAGDGINDTEALQAVLDIRGRIELQSGRYNVDSLILKDYTNLSGIDPGQENGRYSTELYLNDNSGADALIKGWNYYDDWPGGVLDMHYVVLENLLLRGNKTNNPNTHGIKFKVPGWNTSFVNLTLHSFGGDGFYFGDTTGNTGGDNFILRNLSFGSCNGNAIRLETTGGFFLFEKIKVDKCLRAFYINNWNSGATSDNGTMINIYGLRTEAADETALTGRMETIFYFKKYISGWLNVTNFVVSHNSTVAESDSGIFFITAESYPRIGMKSFLQTEYGDTLRAHKWLIQDERYGVYIDKQQVQEMYYPVVENIAVNQSTTFPGITIGRQAAPNEILGRLAFSQLDTNMTLATDIYPAELRAYTNTTDSSDAYMTFYMNGSNQFKMQDNKFYIGASHFLQVIDDTLCGIKGTDTTRINPAR